MDVWRTGWQWDDDPVNQTKGIWLNCQHMYRDYNLTMFFVLRSEKEWSVFETNRNWCGTFCMLILSVHEQFFYFKVVFMSTFMWVVCRIWGLERYRNKAKQLPWPSCVCSVLKSSDYRPGTYVHNWVIFLRFGTRDRHPTIIRYAKRPFLISVPG